MKTLYLHIGTPKTATTAIQIFCNENQEVLHKKGFDYPIFPYKYPHIRIERNAHFLVGRVKNGSGAIDQKREQELLEQGFSMVEESFQTYDNVILSDENIWHATAFYKFDVWKEIKEFVDRHQYRMQVIVYLRRQDHFVNSWLNQQIQDGWPVRSTIQWEDFIKNPTGIKLNYYEHLERIAAVIGKENIDVHIFESKHFKGNGNTIQSDFLEAIGLDMTEDYKISDERQNLTLSLNACEIKRLINSLPDSDSETELFVKNATIQYAGTNKSRYVSEWFSLEERKEFLKQWEESNDRILKEYLHQEDGTLFNMEMKTVEKWTPNNPYMYEDMIYFFGEMILTQQKSINELQNRNKQLKKEIEGIKQDLLWFRLKRKTKHLLGRDKAEK